MIDPHASAALDELPRDDVLEGGYVARIAAELDAGGIDATWETLHGADPAAALCRYAEPYDDVVYGMTTHARAAARLAVLGSVAGGVLHTTRHPVLLLKP